VFEFEKTGIRLQELVKKSLMLVLWPLSMNLSSPVAETHRERPLHHTAQHHTAQHHTAQHRQERKLLIGYTKHSCVLLFSRKKRNIYLPEVQTAVILRQHLKLIPNTSMCPKWFPIPL
jgi:hypothetical protein